MRKPYSLRVSATELNFHAAALVWLCVVACLWVLGWTIAHFSAPPLADPQVAAAFMPWARESIAPEPDERLLYIVLTLLSPLFLLAAWGVVTRWFLPRPGAAASCEWRGSTAWTAGAGLAAFLFGGGLAYLWWSKSILTQILQPVAGVLPAGGAGILAFWWFLTRRERRRSRWLPVWRWACLAAAMPLAVAGGVAYHVFDYRTIGFMTATNLNTTLYPIAQAVAGQRVLVDFLPQYGCYAEMLKPWFKVIGLSVSKVSATLAGLQIISLACMAFSLSRLMRSGWLLLTGVAMLLWLMEIWHEATSRGYDPYIQYDPIRVIFPALSLVAAWAYLRRPTAVRAAAAGLLGGLAVWWNIDSGAVTLASLLGLILARTLSEGLAHGAGAGRWRGLGSLAAAAGMAALGLAGFYVILCLDAGQRVDLSPVLRYQNLFYISGFNMLRMPASPHLWHAVVGMYVLGLTVPLGVLAVRRPLGVDDGMMLYLSVLGLGLFSYYQGRSHNHVLMLCVWPAGMLALVWCDRQLTAARYGLLPRTSAAAALPALAVAALCALSLWRSGGEILQINRREWQLGRQMPSLTHIPGGVAYIKGELRPGEPCAILSSWQTAYFLATPRRSAFTGQSFYECLLLSDVAHYLDQIRGRRAARLFTERAVAPITDTQIFGPDYGSVRYDSYRVVGRGAEGWMLQWAARTDDDARAEPPGRLAREFSSFSRFKDSPPTPRHGLRVRSSAGLLLDPQGECATAPYDWGSVDFAGAWAIEVAFQPAAGQLPYACLLSNHPGNGFDGLTIQQAGPGAPGDFLCVFGGGHSFTASAPMRFEPGREYYLALCGEANRVSIYLNGALQQEVTLPGPMTASATPFTVGDWIAAGRAFRGDIAEVKIHDLALTPEMIARNAANVRAGQPPAPP
jgi:hypothetical protein